MADRRPGELPDALPQRISKPLEDKLVEVYGCSELDAALELVRSDRQRSLTEQRT